MITATKQIRIRITTSNRLDKLKLIPKETYDNIINRILDKLK